MVLDCKHVWGQISNYIEGDVEPELREAIEKRKIRAHVFGHIHECGGMSLIQVQSDGALRDSYNVAVMPVGHKGQARMPLVFEL